MPREIYVNPYASDDDFSLDPETMRRRDAARAAERQYLEDIADLLRTPIGRRFLARHIKSLGYGQQLPRDETAIARHNVAAALLDDVHRASPDQFLALIAAIK